MLRELFAVVSFVSSSAIVWFSVFKAFTEVSKLLIGIGGGGTGGGVGVRLLPLIVLHSLQLFLFKWETEFRSTRSLFNLVIDSLAVVNGRAGVGGGSTFFPRPYPIITCSLLFVRSNETVSDVPVVGFDSFGNNCTSLPILCAIVLLAVTSSLLFVSSIAVFATATTTLSALTECDSHESLENFQKEDRNIGNH
uniref:Uncharacterized protein n=1 Tax=Glossina brevipalpis TaxID=37001 RepID=A0A1A9WYT7_9MUSC